MSLIRKLCADPLALAPEYLAALIEDLEADQQQSQFARLYLPKEDPDRRDDEMLLQVGNLGVIPIAGTIMKNPDRIDRYFGCCDIDRVREMALEALAEPSIDRVLLDISSPGGSTMGLQEAAAALGDLAREKPLFAFTETVMSSAAYWLGAKAEAIYTTPSARLGSIGVYALFWDQSALLDRLGIKVNAISAGKWKLAGAPFKAMTDEEKQMFQARVNKQRDQFHAAVAGRGIAPEHMEGQTFDAEDAVKHGVADGLVGSYEELFSVLGVQPF